MCLKPRPIGVSSIHVFSSWVISFRTTNHSRKKRVILSYTTSRVIRNEAKASKSASNGGICVGNPPYTHHMLHNAPVNTQIKKTENKIFQKFKSSFGRRVVLMQKVYSSLLYTRNFRQHTYNHQTDLGILDSPSVRCAKRSSRRLLTINKKKRHVHHAKN